jgi:peptide/nickel transport system substrate-binding protein
MRRLFLLTALGACATIALGLGVMWSAGGARVPQGHVYTGCAEEPSDVNPLTCRGNAARRLVLGNTHEGLLDVDPTTGELRPCVAEAFELSPDHMQCTFTLRAGVQFSDGSAVTLDDVLFGWELAQAGHLALGFVGDAFARVQAVDRLDDRRFRVHFKDAHYAALRVVGQTWLVAKKQFFVDRVAARCRPAPAPAVDSAEFAQTLAKIDHECGPGTGPYRFDNDPAGEMSWRPHQDLMLVVNPHAWKRAAAPGTWNFAGMRVLFRDQTGMTNALLRREIDWYVSGSPGELLAARPDLQQDYRLLSYDYDALGVYRVVWACQRAPTDDVRVRRALGMLFDVESWRKGFPGIGERALAHAKRDAPEYPRDLVPLAFDPPAARRLLREAGYDREQGRPLELVVIVPTGNEVFERITALFAEAADQAGIQLQLRKSDGYTGIVEAKKLGDWNGYLILQPFRPWGDPWDFVHSQGSENDGLWSNAEVDRLADAARVEPDAGRRAALWREMHTIVYREQPATLLAHPLATILLDKRIQGATTGRSGLVLERAFVAPEKQRR